MIHAALFWWARRRWALIEATFVTLPTARRGATLQRLNGTQEVSKHWTRRGARIAKLLAEENQLTVDEHRRRTGQTAPATQFFVEEIVS